MKESEETVTVIIFRGARSNPWRMKIRKTFVKHGLIWGLALLLIQGGIVTHYAYQWSQLSELEGVKKELNFTRSKTRTFSTEVDGMKKRMLALENLNRKLQTMFGLEPDEIHGLPSGLAGQGGEELPYEGMQDEAEFRPIVTNSRVSSLGVADGSSALLMTKKQVSEIKIGLDWLSQEAKFESEILEDLSTAAQKKAVQWASTPSIWPVNGRITSRFGPRISPFTGKKRLHAGVDVGAPRGTDVRAPASGKIVVAAYDSKMGKFIRIDHGFDIETTYGHLSKIHVKYGDRVHRGDLIGLVGSTGKFSTGPHLHYQVAVNDKVVDPLHYILD